MNVVHSKRNDGSISNLRTEDRNYESKQADRQTGRTIKGLISNSHTIRTADTNITISLPNFS
jgi:hypothetical protein